MLFTLRRHIGVLGFLLISLAAVLEAQTASVMGTITLKGNKPAQNVVVVIASKSAITDIGGRYRIDGVPVGSQKMEIRQGKKVLLTVEVQVKGSVSTINKTLP